MKKLLSFIVVLAILGGIGWAVYQKLNVVEEKAPRAERGPAPVEVASVERGAIELVRVFSGTLETTAQVVVAPKIAGRVEVLEVDLADEVKRGQVVAHLDDGEYVQAVAQAEADLAVAKANLAQAQSAAEITEREVKRIKTLQERGVASDSQFDAVQADQLAKGAAIKVAEAQVLRAEASLKSANIRLGYTRVSATWTGGSDVRVVAQRHAEIGDTIASNTPLLTIVELDPINAVMFVTEKEYGQLQVDQVVHLSTDAYPGEVFDGKITRVSPVFNEYSRQARVELSVENPERKLKPGMFVRVEVMLDRAEDAVIVPVASLVTRQNQTGVFIINSSGDSVTWKTVQTGIVQGERVQLKDDSISGRVVTLGQQMIEDGSEVTIPESSSSTSKTANAQEVQQP